MCCRFFALCRLHRRHLHDDFTLFKVSWNLDLVEATSERTPILVVADPDQMFLEDLGYQKFSRGCENKGFLVPLEHPSEPASQSSDICARKRREFVDFDYLCSLLSDCDDHHDGCKKTGTSDISVPITLIDCETFKLYTASPNMKYAALSYVWGNVSQDDAENSAAHLSSVPLLINDAIIATKSLRLKYLWVDRYCITESDPSIKHEQIKRMDLIYGNAEVTLVALVDNPSDGLPGVSFSRRTRQPSLRIGGMDILGSMGPPAQSIMDSKWWMRAWTLQEAVLSRRRLYFTPEQAYFECCLTHHCETVNFTPTLQGVRSGVTGPWKDLVLYLDSDLSLNHLHELLRAYYERDMTYQQDTVSAFLGILQR